MQRRGAYKERDGSDSDYGEENSEGSVERSEFEGSSGSDESSKESSDEDRVSLSLHSYQALFLHFPAYKLRRKATRGSMAAFSHT